MDLEIKKIKRPSKKPVITDDNIGINPFALNLIIPVNRRYKDVKNKFGDDDKLEFSYEATKFCRVFDAFEHRDDAVRLPIRCKELMYYIIHSMETGKDYVYIEKEVYMANMGIKSVNTFKGAIKGVVNRYIIPHETIKGVYWVNPMYLFKGDRISKFPNRVRVNKENK